MESYRFAGIESGRMISLTLPNQRIRWSSMARQNLRGFSVIQLVIVLQFAAVLSLVAVPRMSAFSARSQLLSGSNQVGFEIARARMQAIGQHKYVRILMVSATQYRRQTSTNGTDWTTAETKTLPSSITSSTTTAQVKFDKNGLATANDSIVLQNPLSQVKTVATSLVGRVTIS
jgi:Tfp pilus assembly protein FimT